MAMMRIAAALRLTFELDADRQSRRPASSSAMAARKAARSSPTTARSCPRHRRKRDPTGSAPRPSTRLASAPTLPVTPTPATISIRATTTSKARIQVETYGASATFTWDLGAMSLISVSGYDHADRDDVEDTDAGPNDIVTARYRAKQWAASEELRLQSNGDNALDWVVGIYLARDDLDSNSYLDVFRVANSGDPDVDLPSGIGVFGWPFTQEIRQLRRLRSGRLRYHRSPDRDGRSALLGRMTNRIHYDVQLRHHPGQSSAEPVRRRRQQEVRLRLRPPWPEIPVHRRSERLRNLQPRLQERRLLRRPDHRPDRADALQRRDHRRLRRSA